MKYIFNIYTFVLFLFFVITTYITYPLLFNMTNVVSSYGDEYLIIWIQNWVIHSLTTNPLSLFNANIYYPFAYSLAYSDIFITTSIIAWPFLLITKEPVTTFTVTLFSSVMLLGFSTFCLSNYITKNSCMSFLSGVMVIFSPVVLDKFTHIQVLSIWGVPFAILFFLQYLDKRRIRYIIFAMIIFVLQIYNSFLPGYFILFSWCVIFLVYSKKKKLYLPLFVSKKIVILCIATCISLLPLIIPYVQFKNEFSFTRDIRDTIHYGLHFEDLVVGNSYTRFESFLKYMFPQDKYIDQSQIKVGYPGLLFFILGIPALVCLITIWRKNLSYITFFGITVVGFILSLGPALHLGRATIHEPFPIILPYALLYYLVPGFSGMRNSARWEMLAIIGLSVLISIFVTITIKKYSPRFQLIVYCLIAVCLLIEFVNPNRFVPITQKKNFPPVYSFIATLPADASIIELPIYPWYMPYSGEELRREYFSTVHFRKMVNGYSGFSPSEWLSLVGNDLQQFPNNNALETLRKYRVQYIILHKNEFTRLYNEEIKIGDRGFMTGDAMEKEIIKSSSLQLVKKFGNDTILYRLKH